MIVAVALLVAAAFGAGDQYLGSFSMHPWMADVSLPFLAGCTQRESKKAALLGLGCTFAALVGYGVMTLSPVENAHVSVASVRGFIISEQRVILGGLLTGPLFGWFGQRRRVDRAWLGALATSAALCLEPLARAHAGQAIRSEKVLLAEVALGLAMAGYFAASRIASREPAR